MRLPSLRKASMPQAPSFRKLLGPSFILLGLGLGSGELILWPYLSANFGLGILWGAVIGITLQFFLNMEIARYTLVKGESIFAGMTRQFGRATPVWFIFATLLPWMWPGIVASSGTIVASLLGIPYTPVIPIVMLLMIGIIYSLGSVIYKTQETLQKIVIMIGVPFIFALAIYLSNKSDWEALYRGIVGVGDGYHFLPTGIPIATFLAALAYAGAGGTLNLAQSLYVKEKGYGMGAYSGRITSLFKKNKENVRLTGTEFSLNSKNVHAFHSWWRKINMEHALVFWGTGALTMLLLSLLSFSTVFGHPDNPTGIQFVINQGRVIAKETVPLLGVLFLITASVMLFFTQFSVLGSTSRIMSENLALMRHRSFKSEHLSYYFFGFLWLQIILGIGIFLLGFKEPLTLVITSAVLNAASMFIYSILLLVVNTHQLPRILTPNILRKVALIIAIFFYGAFTIFTVVDRIFHYFSS